MADTKVSALTTITGANLAAGDLFYVVDVSAGTAGSKSLTYAELSGLFPILAPSTDTRNTITSANATSANLILTMAASQSARPLQIKNNSGTLLLSAGTNGQLISNVTTGTAPLSVDSTTLVANLNADTVDGLNASAFVLNSGYSLGQLLRGTGAGGLVSALDAGAAGQVVGYTTGGALTSITLGSAAMSSTTDFAAASHNQGLNTILTGTAVGASAEFVFTRTGGTSLSGTVEVSAGSTGFALITRDDAHTRTAWIAGNGTITARSLTTTITGGSQPIDVGSNTTKCTNLNADTVDGYDFDTGYTAGVILAGTGAGGAMSKVFAGTAGQVLTYTTGGTLVPATPASGGASTTQRVLFQLPAEMWRGVTANRPEPSIVATTGWSTSTYALAFDSTTTETAQRDCGILPPDLTTSGSIGISLSGSALSATTGSIAWVLSSRQYSTGQFTSAPTDFATISAALPAATTSAYTVGYMTTAAALGWSAGHSLSLQIRRQTTGASTHAGDSLLHAINVREVT